MVATLEAETSTRKTKREVELHSHDFDWEELARQCEVDADGGAHATCVATDSAELQQLGVVAKVRWNEFHQRNNGKAYKPRNYLVKEFPELFDTTKERIQVLEVGCGYGSTIFPILDQCPNVCSDVCDFSAHAIGILKQNRQYDAARCNAFVCDITQDALDVPPASVDIALMVFVLSAIPPEDFAATLQKVDGVLKPGGLLCFRDYGLYDLAMRRNAKRIAPSLYYRSDGTLAYFFSREDVERMFAKELGYDVVENEYCTVRLLNRKKNVTMDRVWLHAKWKKPDGPSCVETQASHE